MKTADIKTRISITLTPKINAMLTQISQKIGISKSKLIEQATEKLLLEKLDADTKLLEKMKFNDLPSEEEWLYISGNL